MRLCKDMNSRLRSDVTRSMVNKVTGYERPAKRDRVKVGRPVRGLSKGCGQNGQEGQGFQRQSAGFGE